jgi:hypothetical protein
MIEAFEFETTPGRVVFGRGAFSRLSDEVDHLKTSRAHVLTTSWRSERGHGAAAILGSPRHRRLVRGKDAYASRRHGTSRGCRRRAWGRRVVGGGRRISDRTRQGDGVEERISADGRPDHLFWVRDDRRRARDRGRRKDDKEISQPSSEGDHLRTRAYATRAAQSRGGFRVQRDGPCGRSPLCSGTQSADLADCGSRRARVCRRACAHRQGAPRVSSHCRTKSAKGPRLAPVQPATTNARHLFIAGARELR